ncbi:MAG TPA: DUF438 domain-containing protein [Spirochaetia bacterium]|nr:DUF438 domain-containing protein [Spirochaetia bacterium]
MASIDPKKRAVVAGVIRRLHKGLSVEEAKTEILRDVGRLTSAEITDIEQGLINEGVSPDEIRRFCNVHALLFESALEQTVASPDSPSHPVSMLKRENREIGRLTARIRELAAQGSPAGVESGLEQLKRVAGHYSLKENVWFPYLEKHGFPGPSRVMWAKHDEVRGLLKKVGDASQRSPDLVSKLLDEVDGMIFKEENILFPAALERISPDEWVQIYKASEEVGYPFLSGHSLHQALEEAEARQAGGGSVPPAAAAAAAPAVDGSPGNAAAAADQPRPAGEIRLPTGSFSLAELTSLLDALPVDVTFVDAEDKVRYFSNSRDRIFVRTTAVIGRSVQNCHPPQSLGKVNEILQSFRDGSRDHADFWIQMQGKFIYIRYFAVRDPERRYLGTLEVTQDLTEIRSLSGERRLLG